MAKKINTYMRALAGLRIFESYIQSNGKISEKAKVRSLCGLREKPSEVLNYVLAERLLRPEARKWPLVISLLLLPNC